MAHTVTFENSREARAAIRDILFMYSDMVQSGGFMHGIDLGQFNPLLFVDAELFNQEKRFLGVDIELLRQGSAVALLCALSDFWDENGNIEAIEKGWWPELQALVDEGRLDHLPWAKVAVVSGLESREPFFTLLQGIHTEYVVGYFQRLLHQVR